MLARRSAFFTSMDERIANCGLVLGIGVVAIAFLSLLSWCWLPVSALAPSGRVQMTPLSSVAFLFSGSSLALLASYRRRTKADSRTAWRPVARIFAAVVMLLGLIKLIGYTLLSLPAVEMLWFTGEGHHMVLPRMSRITAFAHLISGLALVLAARGRRAAWAQTLALAGATIGWLAIARYMYGGAGALPFEPVTFPSASAFILLNVGILLLVCGHGWMRFLVNPTPGGNLVRGLLPGLLVPFVLGWVLMEAQRSGWVSTEGVLALFALSNVLLFAMLIWFNAHSLDHADVARRRAELRWHRSSEGHARLAAIVSSSDDAIIGKTLSGGITSWNKAAQRIFGYSAEEAIGQSLAMLVPEDRAGEEDRIMGEVRAGRAVEYFETVRVCKDGTPIHISATISPIRNAMGEIVGASQIARDITDQRMAIEALRQSDERFQTVLEHMTEGMVIADLTGRLLHWNRSALVMHGFTEEPAWNRDLAGFEAMFEIRTLEGELIPFERWPMRRLLQGQQLRHLEVRLSRKDMPWQRVFSYSGEIVKTPAGQQVAFITITDVTARHEAQQSLRIFRTLVDHSNDSFEIIDPTSGRFLDVNERGCSGAGYTREEFLKLHIFDLDPTFSRETWPERAAWIHREKIAMAEGLHRRKDGSYFPVEVNFRWVELDRPYIVSVVRDIRERRRVEEALRETQTRLQHTLEIGGIGTFSIDFERNRTTYDTSLVNLYGREWNEADGANLEPFLEHVDPADRPAVRATLDKVRQDAQIGQTEFRYVRPDGSVLWLASRIAAEQDLDGNVRRLVGATVDITQRIQSEEVRLHNAELESENRKVQEATRLKSEFLANMSHELRTPLNGIIGFTEFLIDGRPGPLNAKQTEYLTDVYHSSQHLLQLINDVLDLSKIEAGKMALLATSFSLPQAIEKVCSIVKGISDKQGVAVRCHVDPKLTDVRLDEQKVKQILYNLLSNAVKFTNPGGRAEVHVESIPGDRIRLDVTDTGIGIKAEDFPKLFHEFVQLDSGTARHYEGTGLGLALTRKLVELHGGEISVASEVGRGSRFSVVLPRSCHSSLDD